MTWNYQIIKDKNGYCLAEIMIDEKGKKVGWYIIIDTYCDRKKDLISMLEMMSKDSKKSKVLKIKGNKLK
jgi:hypothetical protein